MELKSAIVLAFGLTALAVSSANAAIISYGGYSHDGTTDIVTGGGLEWLQWDRTVGMSIDDATGVLNTIEGGGWSIAGNTEMASLFNAFDFGLTFDTLENTYQNASTGVELEVEVGTDLLFISMFGDTVIAAGSQFDYGEGGFQASSAIFGEDADGDGLRNKAWVFDDYTKENGEVTAGAAGITQDFVSGGGYAPPSGIALVRPSQVVVPEPSLLALLAVGSAGLGFARRKRLQK